MRPFMDESRHLVPLEPGEVPTTSTMYFTSCPLCGPLNDWTDTRAEARKARLQHVRDHKRGAYVPHPVI